LPPSWKAKRRLFALLRSCCLPPALLLLDQGRIFSIGHCQCAAASDAHLQSSCRTSFWILSSCTRDTMTFSLPWPVLHFFRPHHATPRLVRGQRAAARDQGQALVRRTPCFATRAADPPAPKCLAAMDGLRAAVRSNACVIWSRELILAWSVASFLCIAVGQRSGSGNDEHGRKSAVWLWWRGKARTDGIKRCVSHSRCVNDHESYATSWVVGKP
jgi:hypothetical protein